MENVNNKRSHVSVCYICGDRGCSL